MPVIDNASPLVGYYYDSASDKLRPVIGAPGPTGPQGATGPTGPTGPAGVTLPEIYIWGGPGTNTSVTSGAWTIIPVSATQSITSSDGTNPDFTRNSDGTIIINKAGFYDIVGDLQSTAALAANSYCGMIIAATTGAVPGSSDLIAQTTIPSAPTYSTFMNLSTSRYFVAGARIAFLVFTQASGSTWVMRASSINRGAAQGPQGPQGPKGDPGYLGQPGTILHSGTVYGDLGSTTVGGNRDVVSTNIPTQTVATFLQAWVEIIFGYGAGSYTLITADVVRVRDGASLNGTAGNMRAESAAWSMFPMNCFDVIAANVNPNIKARINGVNFNGQNCYQRARINWILYAS